MAKKGQRDANYDYKNHEPMHPMGSGSYANLPQQPIYATFSNENDMRGGIKNSPTCSVDILSQVGENYRE